MGTSFDPPWGCGPAWGGPALRPSVMESEWFELHIEPMGRCVPASADQPLMTSARAAGVELPSSCRNGTCRSCICRLVSGEITYRVEWPGLSADEKREGWILPCVAHPLSDVVIDAPKATSWRLPGR
jgi:ferredoxin